VLRRTNLEAKPLRRRPISSARHIDLSTSAIWYSKQDTDGHPLPLTHAHVTHSLSCNAWRRKWPMANALSNDSGLDEP
jgi:hypothetical protein